MSETLNVFPSNRHEALAILFLKSQDLSGKSPEEIAIMYDDAHSRIKTKLDELKKERKEEKRKQENLPVW